MDDYPDVSQGPESFEVDVDTSNALDFGPVPAGEYKLQCIRTEAKEGTGKNGPWRGFSILCDIPGELSANPVSAIVFLPSADATEKQKERNKSDLAKFKAAWGFGPSETFTLADLEGREAWAYLTLREDPQYGPQNQVRDWIASQG